MPADEESQFETLRVGAVSFFNTRPLVYGLGDVPQVTLTFGVPSRLPALLEGGLVDVALIPVVDAVRRGQSWRIVSDACIGCDGATLTVRVFSRVDPSDITTLHVDRHSHTSVVLASIIWREKYDRELVLVPFDAQADGSEELLSAQAALLIGDKVVRPPAGLEEFSTQMDLGAAWKSLTGLPFVFAVWAAAGEVARSNASQVLSWARDAGVAHAEDIAARDGPGMGWPVELGWRYLTEYLCFTLTERHREGVRRFLELARRHEVLPAVEEPVFA
jgi:chorismate dehydratase